MKDLKKKIDAVIDIKCEALYLHEQILGGSTEAYGEIEKKIEELADRFYEDNGEAIKERQYKTARNDYEYFMVLIEQLLNTYREQTLNDKEESRERK